MRKLLVALALAALVLAVGVHFFFVWYKPPQPKLKAYDYLRQLDIRSPRDLTGEHLNYLLPNVPKELHTRIAEKLEDLGQVSSGEQNFITNVYYLVEWVKDYPPVYDPKRKAEYFATSVAEWSGYIDNRIEGFQERNHTPRQEGIEYWRNRPQAEYLIKEYPFLFTLTEEQKARLLNGNPVFENPYLGIMPNEPARYPVSWQLPCNPAQAYMFERRDEELAPLKVEATPKLVAMKLTVGDIERWDGSTSLQPVARIVAAHAAGIPWSWRRTRDYSKRGDDVTVLTDYYHWAVDDETDSAKTEEGGSYNRSYAKSSSYDPLQYLSPPPPRLSPEAKPTTNFLNYFKFNQTHDAFVNVIEGNRDLMFATRKPSEDERRLAKEKNVELECTPFARDAFVFLVNRHNSVRNLTLKQVRDIFAGKITKWKDIGGVAGMIQPLIRDRNSGSEELMRELVMGSVAVRSDFRHQLLGSMSGVYDWLEKDMEGIGYTILYYDRYMVCNPYTRTLRIDGVEPTPQTVADGSYPLLYECVAVTRKDEPARARLIADWLVSKEGQAVVRETGYVPLLP